MESGWWTMTWTRKMAFKQITEHFVWVNMNFFILVLFMILIEENLYNGKLKDSLGSKAAGLVDGVPFCCSVVTSWAGYIRTHSQRTVPGVRSLGSVGGVLCSAWTQGVDQQFTSECFPIIVGSHSNQL